MATLCPWVDPRGQGGANRHPDHAPPSAPRLVLGPLLPPEKRPRQPHRRHPELADLLVPREAVREPPDQPRRLVELPAGARSPRGAAPRGCGAAPARRSSRRAGSGATRRPPRGRAPVRPRLPGPRGASPGPPHPGARGRERRPWRRARARAPRTVHEIPWTPTARPPAQRSAPAPPPRAPHASATARSEPAGRPRSGSPASAAGSSPASPGRGGGPTTGSSTACPGAPAPGSALRSAAAPPG